MAISIDWGTKVITVPQADLTFISGTVYEMNVDNFRLTLKDLEDDAEGMPFLDTHRHIAPVTLSGTTYARFVEIINGYTITFEDGLYQVNLNGANTNIVDVLNRNSVSVVANNSTGLISSSQLEYSSFDNGVTVNVTNGVSGTAFPIGTTGTPVNNLTDALSIAQTRGLNKFYIHSSMTINGGLDFSNHTFEGLSRTNTSLTIDSSANVTNCEFNNCTIAGTLDGGALLQFANINTLDYVNGIIKECVIDGPITLGGASPLEAILIDTNSGIAGSSTPVIDMGGNGPDLQVRGHSGGLKLTNKSGSNACTIELEQGNLIIDSTVTAGAIFVRGIGTITDNSTGTATVDTSALISVESISAAVWNKLVQDHLDDGSFGEKIGEKLLTTSKFIALK